jgi:hypothetical protein
MGQISDNYWSRCRATSEQHVRKINRRKSTVWGSIIELLYCYLVQPAAFVELQKRVQSNLESRT